MTATPWPREETARAAERLRANGAKNPDVRLIFADLARRGVKDITKFLACMSDREVENRIYLARAAHSRARERAEYEQRVAENGDPLAQAYITHPNWGKAEVRDLHARLDALHITDRQRQHMFEHLTYSRLGEQSLAAYLAETDQDALLVEVRRACGRSVLSVVSAGLPGLGKKR